MIKSLLILLAMMLLVSSSCGQKKFEDNEPKSFYYSAQEGYNGKTKMFVIAGKDTLAFNKVIFKGKKDKVKDDDKFICRGIIDTMICDFIHNKIFFKLKKK